jgi:hypothetical protein
VSIGDQTADSRRVICARCGAAFECALSGDCWCAHEPVRRPMPVDSSEDCLCRDCLRATALPSP